MTHLHPVTRARPRGLFTVVGLLVALLAMADSAEAQRPGKQGARTARSAQGKHKQKAVERRAKLRTDKKQNSRRTKRQAEKALHRNIKMRRSPRAYQKRPVAEHKVQSLLLAAHSAPSAFGVRPYKLIAIDKAKHPKQYKQVYDALVEKNQEWVGERPPVLIVGAYEKNYEYNGEPNPHAQHDLGMATMNLSNQASHLGLSVRHMSGFNAKKVRKGLKIPKGFEPFSVTAVGYEASPKVLPKEIQGKEARRRGKTAYQDAPLGQTASYGVFSNPVAD